jgi:transcriptional regulator with XRE-family HTH domain
MIDEHIVATTSERLKYAIAYRHTSAAEISKATGISRGSLSQYISGKFSPKQDRIYILATHLRVSPSWLMGLDVPMERGRIRTRRKGTMSKRFRRITLSDTQKMRLNCLFAKTQPSIDIDEEVKKLDTDSQVIIMRLTLWLKQLNQKFPNAEEQELLKKYNSLDETSQLLVKGMIDKLLLAQSMAQKNTAQTRGEDSGTQKGTPSLKQVP